MIAGGAIGSFHLLDENCTGIPLSPEATCTLLVSFQPLSTGVKTARLGLFGDSDGGTQITLTGVGIEPEVEAGARARRAPRARTPPRTAQQAPRASTARTPPAAAARRGRRGLSLAWASR